MSDDLAVQLREANAALLRADRALNELDKLNTIELRKRDVRRDEAEKELARLRQDALELIGRVEGCRRLLFDVMHQRTGPGGEKIEDLLLRVNERLLHKVTGETRQL